MLELEAKAAAAEVVISVELQTALDQALAPAQVLVIVPEESGLLVDMPMLEVQVAVVELDKLMVVPIPWVMGMDLDQVLAMAPDMMIVVFMGGTRRRLVVVTAMAEVMGKLVDMATAEVMDKGMGIVVTVHQLP
ncbi:unnamed protein product, partial [Urochloa humidicola]